MRELYREIAARLQDGQGSELTTQYSPQGIRRRLAEIPMGGEPKEGLTFTKTTEGCTLVERFLPKPRLLILGGGHIALPLVELADMLGFETWVYDDRPSFVSPARFPRAHRVICGDFSNIGAALGFRRGDYVTILTRGHRHDMICLQTLFQGGEVPHYVGMIGSKRRIAIVKEQAAAQLADATVLDRLYAPIGLPIGSVTPEEIALSILAEIVKIKRLGPDGRRNKALQEGGLDEALLHWLSDRKNEALALVTIVSTRGSTPREQGAKMAVKATGEIQGSIGGGCTEAEVLKKARDVIDQGGYLLMEVDLTDAAEEEGMVCGGVMEVLIEAIGTK